MLSRKRFYEIDVIRWLMILWIFITHFYEHSFSNPIFANPSQNWPGVVERFTQLNPLPYTGISSIFSNIFRYLGLFGDQGVQVFFVISGFTLTYSLLGKSRLHSGTFYKKRFIRIYPSWVITHLALMGGWVLVAKGMSPFSLRSWFSLLGIRFLPQTFYHAVPAWWFIGCLLQLYLVFPILYKATIEREKSNILWSLLAASILLRLFGLFISKSYFPGFIDYWSRGLFFFSRLPEFISGIIIAVKYHQNPEYFRKFLTQKSVILISFVVWIAGNIASFFYYGMAIAFWLTGVGMFLFLLGILSIFNIGNKNIFSKLSAQSYEFYLVHHIFIIALVPSVFPNMAMTTVYFIAVLLGSFLSALLLNKISTMEFVVKTFGSIFTFTKNNFIKINIIALLVFALLFVGELIVQRNNPQEVFGWGEKASLQINDEFGYNLIENKTTRLRWQSYDYIVNANRLGFPGPMYSKNKGSDTYRIVVVGDAFSSAEGVDTDESWPRLLEHRLNERYENINYEIINFSITGWGPQHYSRVLEKYVPEYKPDLIILGIFINDLVDVLATDEDFIRSIGFSQHDQLGLHSKITLKHTRSLIRQNIRRLEMFFHKELQPRDYYLGLPSLIEKENYDRLVAGSRVFRKNLLKIVEVAHTNNASIMSLLIPSSFQVAPLSELKYVRNDTDFSDSDVYDLAQAQRILIEILSEEGVDFLDLRKLFTKDNSSGLYQPGNMHWTEKGHKSVAEHVLEFMPEM